MINPVANVSFRGDVTSSEWNNLIASEGQYTQKPAETAKPDSFESASKAAEKEKKGGKAGKIIGGTLAAVVVAGLALFGLSRANILKVDKNAKGFMAKAESMLAEAGEWIGTKMIDPLIGLFGKKGAKAADKTADAAKDAANSAS